MPRNERLLHGAHLLDASAVLPRRRWQSERPFRRSVARPHQQHGQDTRQRAQKVQLPVEALQPRAQGAGQEGSRLLREFSQLLRKEPQTWHRRNARARVQRDVHRCRWLRSHVLRKGLQDRDQGGGRKVRLHFPLVLRSQVQSLQDEEDDPHLSVEFKSTRFTSTTSLYTNSQCPPPLHPLLLLFHHQLYIFTTTHDSYHSFIVSHHLATLLLTFCVPFLLHPFLYIHWLFVFCRLCLLYSSSSSSFQQFNYFVSSITSSFVRVKSENETSRYSSYSSLRRHSYRYKLVNSLITYAYENCVLA